MALLTEVDAAFEEYIIQNFMGVKYLFAERPIYFMDGSYVPVSAPVETEPFVRFYLRFTYTEFGEFGANGCDIRNGLVIAQIFTPLFEGTRRSYQIADTIEGLLKRKTIPPLEFFRAETQQGVKNGNYYQTNVNVEFKVFQGV